MLIVFEGLHSAGKSTQIAALVQWLRERGALVTLTSWNSSPPLGATITGLKMASALSPIAMVLMEAADLAYRYEHGLRDALDGGDIVVADRWSYSTVVRAVPRGVARDFVRDCFAFAPRPDLVFYLRCTARETLSRRLAAGLPLQGHLIGTDLEPGIGPREGYLRHQGQASRLYDATLPPDTVVLSCHDHPDVLRGLVVAAVQAHLPAGV